MAPCNALSPRSKSYFIHFKNLSWVYFVNFPPECPPSGQQVLTSYFAIKWGLLCPLTDRLTDWLTDSLTHTLTDSTHSLSDVNGENMKIYQIYDIMYIRRVESPCYSLSNGPLLRNKIFIIAIAKQKKKFKISYHTLKLSVK